MDHEDVPTILHEFVQPRVINQDLLINLIIEQGPKGTAGKLFYEDGIDSNETEEIRIEFLNILKIDHLWVMPNLVKLKLSNNIIEKIENLDVLVNLKELDLSFNRIELMENLDSLVNLEILLLFNNQIAEVEGLDNLRNLTILSVGNNFIADWKHVLYLRKFKKLYSLNMNGNPCTKEDGYLDYVYAFMPRLIYYEYKMITVDQRRAAKEKHYRDLNILEETEKKKDEELQVQQKYEEKLAFLTTAYMEHLDEDYVFHQMFQDDKEGRDLSMVNEDTQNAYEEYKVNFVAICKEFCEVGVKEHEKRMEEVNAYDTCMDEGKTGTQNQGRRIVNEVLQKKGEYLANVKQLLKKLIGEVDTATVEDVTKKAQQIAEEFHDLVTDAWTNLMSLEVELHEQIEEINEVFRINISDMVEAFITTARGYFSQLRNCEAEYNDTINGLILYLLSGIGDDAKLPRHLINLCEDKDMLNHNLTNSHERHLQVLDAREDTLVTRVKDWLEELTNHLIKNELERNSERVIEISHFSDSQQQEFLQILAKLNLKVNDQEIIMALDT